MGCMDTFSDDDMTGEKRANSIHVRVGDEADAMLELMRSASGGRTKAEIAGELIEEALLGKGHSLRMAAMRFARLGFPGRGRE